LPWGGREEDSRCRALKERMRRELVSLRARGFDTFLCGMAMGCDTYFAEAVLRLRAREPETRLWAALPCRGQDERWPLPDQARRRALLSACDEVFLLQEAYDPGCMRRRNLWMLERAGCLMTVYDGGTGGTAWTVREARRRGVPLVPLWL